MSERFMQSDKFVHILILNSKRHTLPAFDDYLFWVKLSRRDALRRRDHVEH